MHCNYSESVIAILRNVLRTVIAASSVANDTAIVVFESMLCTVIALSCLAKDTLTVVFQSMRCTLMAASVKLIAVFEMMLHSCSHHITSHAVRNQLRHL